MRVALAALSLTFAAVGSAEPRVGDTYEVTLSSEMSQISSSGSTESSSDRDVLVEHVVAVRENGLDIEYDLPRTATKEERAAVWQFPVRIFMPLHGTPQILDRPRLKARVDSWLKAAGVTRAACGHWFFTWDAFRVGCDPQSAIALVQRYDFGSSPADGYLYQDPLARDAAALRRTAIGSAGSTFAVQLTVDPDKVRKERADADLVVAEVSRKTLTREAADRAHASENIVGTITVTLEADSAGDVWRRAKTTKLSIKHADGQSEDRTVRETLERRLISRARS